MNFIIENTSNLNIIKYSSKELLFSETKEYNKESNTNNPLLHRLLSFPFVKNILCSGNFIAIEKVNYIAWEDIQEELLTLIESQSHEIVTPKKIPISIYAEMTPNPNVMKYVSNILLYNGIAEIKSLNEAQNAPLATALFQKYDFIEEVFIAENYISITKKLTADFANYVMEIREFLWNYIRERKEIVSAQYVSKTVHETYTIPDEKNLTEIELKIKDILEEYIKPAVANDGGNIELIAFDNETKTAKMLLQGACSGCPSSTFTLKNGIERMLKQMLPNEVETVEAVNG